MSVRACVSWGYVFFEIAPHPPGALPQQTYNPLPRNHRTILNCLNTMLLSFHIARYLARFGLNVLGPNADRRAPQPSPKIGAPDRAQNHKKKCPPTNTSHFWSVFHLKMCNNSDVLVTPRFFAKKRGPRAPGIFKKNAPAAMAASHSI